MRVEHLGDDSETPEIAILAGVHGDEPCGVRAVERLLADPPAVERPVKLVVANEAALARGVRYVDEDLNAIASGEPDASVHERRLAFELERELAGCVTLSLHATRSSAIPFALVHEDDDRARRLCPHLPVEAVVEERLETFVRTIDVECGLQGTEAAAENAKEVVRAFLAATGVLSDVSARRSLPVFRLTRPLPKSSGESYEVFVENFEPVAPGETWAAVDGQPLVAEEGFVPVLVSADGYEEQFGYAAEQAGTME